MAFLKISNRDNPETVLFGTQLELRQPVMADYDQWARLRGRSEAFLRPFEPGWSQDELTRRSYKKRVEFYRKSQIEGNAYAFFLKSRGHQNLPDQTLPDQTLLGGVTLSNVRHGVVGSAQLGYWIGEEHARKGYMGEALRLVLPFAFKTLFLHRLEAACLPGNEASVALLRQNGFVQEGVARKYLKINGVWQDHLLFALLAEDS